MQIITINLPVSYLEAIRWLTNNRSEYIRIALKEFLEPELDFKKDLEVFNNGKRQER